MPQSHRLNRPKTTGRLAAVVVGAALLSGRSHHTVGMGGVTEIAMPEMYEGGSDRKHPAAWGVGAL